MKTPRVVARRRLAVALSFLLAAAGAVIAPPSASAVGSDPNCDPGKDCTGFEQGTYVVTEGDHYLDMNVLAAWCCPVGQGQIDYATFDGSARGGRDFQHTSGTLTYAGGGWGGIRIPISDDALWEGEEQFEVRLTNFRGTFVNRGHETAVVSILDRAEEEGSGSSGSSTPAVQPPPARGGSGPKASLPQLFTTARPGPPAPAVAGSVDAPNEKGDADAADPNQSSGPVDANPAAAFSAMERPDPDRRSAAPLAGLASLLLVTALVRWSKRPGAKPT